MFESLFRRSRLTLMMRFFPNITRASPLTRIRIARLLPRAGELVVSRGQEVTAGQIVARCPEVFGYHVFDAGEALGIGPGELPEHVLVEEGEQVFRGKPLVRKPARFGRGSEYRSGIDGVLHSVNGGYLILQQHPHLLELRAMVSAQVASVVPSRGVVLETIGTMVEGLWHSGHASFGRLQVLTNSDPGSLDLTRSDGAMRGSIVVAGSIEKREVLQNLIDRGVAGLVAGSMPATLCAQSTESGLGVILTDGIGHRTMAGPLFELLAKAEGKEATLLTGKAAETRGRPRVVIPMPAERSQEPSRDGGENLEIGRLVRIWRREAGPHVGRVARLHLAGRRTGSGLHLPGADVELADGRVIFVPFSNLDLLVMG